MKISSRETVLFLATAGIGLFGVTALLARPRFEEWKDLHVTQRQVIDSIERSNRLIAGRAAVEAEYDSLTGKFPPVDKKAESKVHWLTTVEEIASKRGLKLLAHKIGKESDLGDICELTIDCSKWEGTIDALVHFLFDLQQKDAMVDVQYLRIKPKDKALRTGRFILSCAYMRKE